MAGRNTSSSTVPVSSSSSVSPSSSSTPISSSSIVVVSPTTSLVSSVISSSTVVVSSTVDVTTTIPVSTSSSVAPESTSSVAAASSSSASSASASLSSASSSISSAGGDPSTIYSTTFVYVTATNSQGSQVTSASASLVGGNSNANSGSKKSSTNIGAIVGGVVGGIVALALLAGLGYYFYKKNKNANRSALDDRMFDPSHSTNHSMKQTGRPDLLSGVGGGGGNEVSPFMAGAAGVGAGSAGAAAYGSNAYAYPSNGGAASASGYGGNAYPSGAEGAAHGSGYAGNAYPSGTGMEHGYGADQLAQGANRYSGGWGAAAALGGGAAAGAAAGGAYGAFAGRDREHEQAPVDIDGGYPGQYQSPNSPPIGMSAAALAKHREAQGYRNAASTSASGYGSTSGYGHGRNPSYDSQAYAAGPSGAPRTGTAPSSSGGSDYGGPAAGMAMTPMSPRTDGSTDEAPSDRRRSGVLVHEDGGRLEAHDEAEGEGPAELPPTYNSIPADR